MRLRLLTLPFLLIEYSGTFRVSSVFEVRHSVCSFQASKNLCPHVCGVMWSPPDFLNLLTFMQYTLYLFYVTFSTKILSPNYI